MILDKPIMVAELSINHLGMVNIAKKMIDEAVANGANLIKLKYKNVKKYYKDDSKKWRNFSFKKYRESLELSKEDFEHLAKYCHDKISLQISNNFQNLEVEKKVRLYEFMLL